MPKPDINLDILDFMSLPDLMNRVFLIDIVPNAGRRLRFRYTGTALDKEYGANLMGRYFEDVYNGSNPDLIVGSFHQAIDRRQTSYLRQHIVIGDSEKKSRVVERIAFPISEDGESTTHLCGIVTFMPGSTESEDLAVFL